MPALLRSLICLGLSCAALQAHQPYESSAIARMETDGLEVVVTVSNEIASKLIGASITDEASLDLHRPKAREAAAGLYEVSVNGETKAPQRVFVTHRGDEVVFSLLFPPVKPSGLRLRAAYLENLPRDYGGTLLLLDEKGQMIETPPVLRHEVGLDTFSVPAKKTALKSPPSPAWEKWGVWAASALVALFLLRLHSGPKIALTLLLLSSTGLFAQRQMERLGRGLVTIKSNSTQVYVGWRLLGNDPEDIAFNLYRSANGATAVKVNTTPITATADYLDTPPSLSTTAYTYSIKTVLAGAEVTDVWANLSSGPSTLPANAPQRQYLPITLQQTPDGLINGNAYRVKFAWVGDLDGDGEFDFVVERTNASAATPQWLQAYKRDSTLLWQMSMGPNSTDHYNITPGSSTVGIGHGDNVTVYDMDGDGLAEVILRTANGVIFANGSTLTAATNELQYISILDGLTGLERARSQIILPASWAHQGKVNSQFGIVYADGLRPSLVMHAANRDPTTQNFNRCVITWDYRSGVLSQRWLWNPATGEHRAEGHQIRIADVNNDGTDEYIDIGHVLKADGSAQINGGMLTELTHGDRFHVADVDPDVPGLETYIIQQNNGGGLAAALFSSDKSRIIKKHYTGSIVDVGRGTIGAFVPGLFGLQYFSTIGGTYDRKGNEIYADSPFPPETIWWDGNLSRETLSTIGQDANSPGIDRFNTATPGFTSRVLTIYTDDNAPNAPFNNYIADGGRPQFWGDILGDWREELVCVASDNSELRIYTTKTVDEAKTSGGAPLRIYTLMHNPQYRVQTTTKGYVQSSYVDYYLGYGMTPPPPPFADAKLVWRGGNGSTSWDLSTPSWKQNSTDSAFTNGDSVRFDASANSTTSVTLTGTLQPSSVAVFSPKDHVFDGSGTLTGTMKLTKSGAGKLTLNAAHTFTGKTTVWDGALINNGSLTNSAVTVWGGTWGGAAAKGQTGGRIGGSGTFGQNVVVKYRGAITPTGTLSFANHLTAEDGATWVLNPANNDRIAVSGTLTLSGTVSLVVNGTLTAGNYTLATYSSLNGSAANLALVLPDGSPGTLSVSSTAITLNVPVMRSAAAVTWRGTGSAWDVAASTNWLNGGSPDVFASGDSVTFDATGAASPTVNLTTALPVSAVIVNAATDYTFNGPGYLSGSGGLTKSGSGTLTLNTSNTYTGPTTINGGILAVSSLGDADAASAIGAATAAAANLVINGGTLRLTGAQTNTSRSLTLGSAGGTFDITQSSSSIQISGSITGSGALTKTGPGTLLLVNANTYSGGTVIQDGKVYVGAAGETAGLGSGSVTLINGRLSMANTPESYETATWNLIVPSGANARFDADGRSTLTGSITGSGTLTFYTPYIRTELEGNWSGFSGRLLVIASSDGGDFRIGNTQGYNAAAIDLGANVSALYNLTPGTNGSTVPFGELSGAATAQLAGSIVADRRVTYQIGARNSDSTFAGIIKNATGDTALTKVGTGKLILSGANTYTGPTSVNAGTLAVNGSLTSSVTVMSGATLGGSGTITGDVTVQSGGKLAFTVVNGVVTGLNITGNLTLNGSIVITPVPGTGAFAQGSYTIAAYSGTLSGTPAFLWQPEAGQNQTATIDTSTPGLIKINVTRGAATITWTGATSAAWDTATANWSLNGFTETFISPDSVVFDDSSSVNAVNLTSPLSPTTVSFANSTQNYALTTSAGGTSGSAALMKSGSGTLSLTGGNSHTGGSVIDGGSVNLIDDAATISALGSGIITLQSGTVQMRDNTSFTTATWHIHVPANASPTLRMDQRIDLSGSFTGGGTLNAYVPWIRTTLYGNASAFTGVLNLSTDADGCGLRLSHSSGWPGAALVLADKVNVQYFGNAAFTIPLGEVSGVTGSTLSGLNNNNSGVNANTLTWEVGARGTDATFAGNITNGASPSLTAIRKVGSGKWTLTGTSSYTGPTNVIAGTLCLAGTASGSSITVASGAVLDLHEASSLTTSTLTNNGTVRLYGAAALTATTVINNGIIDAINATTVPANLSGTVLRASDQRIQSTTKNVSGVSILMTCHPGHSYKLQTSTSLASAAWTDVPATTFTPTTSTAHTFTDPSPGIGPKFYRVVIETAH